VIKIDWKLVVAIIALLVAIFAGIFWHRADVIFDHRAVEIPLSEPLRRNIENALASGLKLSDSVSVLVNGKPAGSSPTLPSTKLPDKLLYVNIRNVGHVPSGRIKTRIVIPGEIADMQLTDAGSAFGSIDQRTESDTQGEVSFECSNLANHPQARIKVALWYQQTKSGTPLIEIQDTTLGPARDVGSVDTASFYWWDWSAGTAKIVSTVLSTLAVTAMLLFEYLFSHRKRSRMKLTAVYDPQGCSWAEASVEGVPSMQVCATASFATFEDRPIEVVQAYLKGTRPTASLMGHLVVSKESAVTETFHFFVQPVVGKPGEALIRSIVLVDQHGNKYEGETVPLKYRGATANSPRH
jgi:hypothetical protein